MPSCELPVRSGQSLLLDISSLAPGGDGVASVGGLRIFVPHSAPGDKVQAVITELHSTYARAKVLKVQVPGRARVVPACPVAGECGGCAWQHLGYSAQAAAKESFVRETLRRVGGFQDPPVRPIVAAPNAFAYRNKAQVPVGLGATGSTVVGYYREGSHQIIELPEQGCGITEPAVNAALLFARQRLPELGLTPYDEATRSGQLRHVLARCNRAGEAMLGVVTAAPMDAKASAAAAGWLGSLPGLKSVLNNVQPRGGNVILGSETRVLAGAETLIEDLGGLKFRLSAQSFFQVNAAQTLNIWSALRAARKWTGAERVLELYAGVGTLSLALAGQAREWLGVDEVAAAVADGNENARLNGLPQARFVAAPCEQAWQHWQGGPPDLVLMDPPRKGLSEAVRTALLDKRPRELLYVSCDPASLARDLKALGAGGYQLGSVQPLDLFPQTPHVESVAWLSL